MSPKPDYTVLIHAHTVDRAKEYLASLQSGSSAGELLKARLQVERLSDITIPQFIEHLLRTKKPQIFAEMSVSGNGSDWNQAELSILGDISIAVPVTVYDNGLHRNPQVHKAPLDGTLLFTPGALLRNGREHKPVDWDEVVNENMIDEAGFYTLYERRLLPAFLHASKTVLDRGRKALITIPGLGCGQFAGPFSGELGAHLQSALSQLIDTHKTSLDGIKAVYFDPYSECENSRQELGNISFLVRPLSKGNFSKPQLCHPTHYEEPRDDFTDCDLFSVVAWDHVSWPGNDFFVGSRATDDGVKAAATNSMQLLTGIEGAYDEHEFEYRPPGNYQNWEDVVEKNGLELEIQEKLQILPEG